MPAENVPPAPVRTYAEMSGRASSSSSASAMPRATAPLTAFLRLGAVDRDDGDAVGLLDEYFVRHETSLPGPGWTLGLTRLYLGWKRMPPSKRTTSAFM